MRNFRRFQSVQEEKRTDFPPIEISRSPTARYPEIDPTTSQIFIYSANQSKRQYQFEISQALVRQNTLVVLPTGLGKTFIAEMAILNFYRWFPTGKIVFLAPTRPLVMQQFRSIKSSLPIPNQALVELTGQTEPSKRSQMWTNSSIFFATPQTVQNDIEKNICPASQIVLLVIDEAHRSRGDHSYCKIVKSIAAYTKQFRIVALSATPGQTFDDVQQIIYNLMISRIEIRTDKDCQDYVHNRQVKTEIIPQTQETLEVLRRLNSIIRPHLVELLKLNLVSHADPTRTSKGVIARLISTSPNPAASPHITSAIRLLTLRETLQNYSVPIFIQELSATSPMTPDLKALLDLAGKLPQKDQKLDRLCEIVVEFLHSSDTSKILIFCNLRVVVHAIVKKLSSVSPVVKCAEFIGQATSSESKGLNQSKQINIINDFRKGIINTLVSTSIGEEGLDIGEVDLAICFDMQKSITRTIQRMGRTGRQRDGTVVFLINETQKVSNDSEGSLDFVTKTIKRRMKDFRFYLSPAMNDSELQVVDKPLKIEREEETPKIKERIKRATLLTSELEEMRSKFGETLSFAPFNFENSLHHLTSTTNFALFGCSNESRLMSDVLSNILEAEFSLSGVFGEQSSDLSVQYSESSVTGGRRLSQRDNLALRERESEGIGLDNILSERQNASEKASTRSTQEVSQASRKRLLSSEDEVHRVAFIVSDDELSSEPFKCGVTPALDLNPIDDAELMIEDVLGESEDCISDDEEILIEAEDEKLSVLNVSDFL